MAARLARAQEKSRQLTEGLESRAVIARAVGLLMGQQQLSADAALAQLRTESQQTNTKLRELAARLLADFEQRRGVPGTAH